VESAAQVDNVPVFDKKYKTIVVIDSNVGMVRYTEIMQWLQENAAGNVSVQVTSNTGSYCDPSEDYFRTYYAFENSDDALFFRIKYK
jgi:hypothetical protein